MGSSGSISTSAPTASSAHPNVAKQMHMFAQKMEQRHTANGINCLLQIPSPENQVWSAGSDGLICVWK